MEKRQTIAEIIEILKTYPQDGSLLWYDSEAMDYVFHLETYNEPEIYKTVEEYEVNYGGTELISNTPLPELLPVVMLKCTAK